MGYKDNNLFEMYKTLKLALDQIILNSCFPHLKKETNMGYNTYDLPDGKLGSIYTDFKKVSTKALTKEEEINKITKSIKEQIEYLDILLDAAKRLDIEVKFSITEDKTQDVKAIIYNMEDMSITSQYYTKQEIL